MQDKPLRVLMVENSEDDALLIMRNLKKGGFNPVHERVKTAAAMKKALSEKQWDVILCDYSLPRFNAPSAIAVLKEATLDIPLIIVTGTVGEETAAECMRLGARDYIMKGNLSRLCPVISRELAEAKARNKEKHLEEKLHHEKQRFRAFVEHSSDIIVILSLEGTITYINPAVEKVLGFKPEERIGAKGFELVHPDDMKLLADSFNTLSSDINAPVMRGEIHLRHKDGSWRTLEAVGSNLVNDNVVEFIIVNYRDITERKQAEKALRESKYKYKSLIENIPDIIFTIDLEGKITFASKKAKEILGYENAEMINRNIFDFIPEEAHQSTMEKLQKGMKGEKIKHVEMPVTAKSGEKLFFDFSFTRLYKDGAVVGAQGTAVDITERKHAEEKLLENERQYKLLTEKMSDIIWIADMNLQTIYTSPSVKNILGFSQEERLRQKLDEQLTPHSLSLALDVLSRELALEEQGNEDPDRTLIIELEYYHKDGSTRWMELVISGLRNDQGVLTRICGVSREITARKHAEEKLRKEEQRFRVLAEQSSDIILLINREKVIIYENPAVDKILGLKREERIGKNVLENLHPDDVHVVLNAFNTLIEDRNAPSQRDELRIRHADGSWRTFEVVGSNLTHEDIVEAMLINLRDITERKEAEEKIQQTLESLRKAVGTTIQVLVSAVESRDTYTSGHQSRSANLACAIATEMELSQEKIEGIRMAGIIHDIGKLSIPAEILSKPTKLTEIEFSLIKEHARSGYEMLKDVESPWPLAEIVYQHHERINGTGYPRKMKGDEILMESRILAVADVVEAMASHRPYRPTLGIEAALEEIEKNKGILYDDTVVDTCLKLFREKGYKLQ
jgi:PAS domain S-box-containing protein